jgi:uncharacterized membrane protein
MLVVIKKGSYEIAFKALAVLICTVSMILYNFTGWAMYNNQTFAMFTIVCLLSIKIFSTYKEEIK